ncbi:hypothetical protein L9F63_014745, partial [Diploptera punctata]
QSFRGGKEKRKENVSSSIIEESVHQGEINDSQMKPITIKINTIENIQDTNVKIKVQHGDKILGESDLIILQDKIGTPINFETILWYTSSEMSSLDEIVANPVLFTINEFSINQNAKNSKPSKDLKKPSKEDNFYNIQPLGQCNLDLFPLFLGELSIQENLLIQQVKQLTPQEMITWPNLPKLTVTVTIAEHIVSPEQFEAMNILFITLESMYNIPTRMTENMQYSAATVFPLQTLDFHTVFFQNGAFKTKKQVGKYKQWAGFSDIPGRNIYSLYNMSEDVIRSNLTLDFNAKLNEDAPRIEWNMLRRCLITAAAGETIYETLAKYRCWILEIMVSEQHAVPTGSSKSKDTDTTSKLHYVAYLDFSTLLFPGVNKVRAAAQIFSYTCEDVVSKFGLSKPLFENINPEPTEKESTSTTKTKPTTSSGKTKKSDTKSSSKITSQPTTSTPEESVPIFKEEGEPVFVIMQMELYKPLMKKRTTERLETLISEIIPPRPPLPKRVMSAELAEKHYSQCIKTLLDIITKEYQKYIQINTPNAAHFTEVDEFQTSFFYFMNTTGVYNEMKTTLKEKIATLLQEKSDIRPDAENNLSKQNYICDVYIYLVEEMYKVINSLIRVDDCVNSSLGFFTISTDMMLLYAMEADEMDLIDKASHWYLKRFAQDNQNPNFWLDYGIFYLKYGQKEIATEYVLETLTLDSRHKLGLLLYATLLAQEEEYHMAEIFFDALTNFYPKFAEAWITFHLFYLKIENYVGAEIALTMSTKCFVSKKDFESVIDTESLSWCTTNYSNDSLFLITAITLTKLHMYEFAEMALAQELIYNKASIPYMYYLSVLHYLEGRYQDAINHITTAVKQHGKDYCLWSLMGHCHHQLGNKTLAIECYQHVVDSFDRPNEIHLVQLRLGERYLEEENYEMARTLFIDVCKYTPTPVTWSYLGIACYKLENYMEAEVALIEGNALDNKHVVTWGYLALTNLQFERSFEFEQCYRQAIRHGLQDETIIQEIKILQKKLKYPDPVPLIYK